MIYLWTGNLPLLINVTSGGIALIPFTATAFVLRKRTLRSLAGGLAVIAGLLNIAIELAHQSNASNNILNRDIGAVSLLAFACPLTSAMFARSLQHRSALVRVIAATVVVASFVFVAPFFVLIAHCTSGDCV